LLNSNHGYRQLAASWSERRTSAFNRGKVS
jgi:hypothetical protein